MIVKENKEDTSILDNIFSLLIPKDKSITDIFPYKRIEKDNETVVTKDSKFQAFFKVKTTDLSSLSEDEFMRIVNRFTYLNKVYLEPYKIYSLTYPTETVNQCIYWKNRINNAKKAILKNKDEHLEKYLRWNLKLALDNYEKVKLVTSLPELQFVIAVYGDTKKELRNHAEVIKQAGGKELGLTRLKGEDLKNVIKKIMNPNSPI